MESSVRMADALPLCPQCQSTIHADWPYCSHCGSRLWTGPIPPPPVPICAHCGAQADPTGSFCWWCGVPLARGREPVLPVKSIAGAATVEGGAPSVAVGPAPRSSPGTASRKAGPARPASRRSVVGGVLLLIGIAILVTSLFVGWYAVSATAFDDVGGSSFTASASATLYPLNYLSETFTCQGSSVCFANSTYAGAYSQSSFTSLGTLYGVVAGLVVAGIALGAGAVAFAFLGGYRRTLWAGRLAVLAVVVVVLAPTLLLVAQPAVLNAQGAPPGGTSPRSSFSGSCTGSQCGTDVAPGETTSASWGPSIGWYLGFVAVVPLLLGWLEIRSRRKRSAAAGVYQLAR